VNLAGYAHCPLAVRRGMQAVSRAAMIARMPRLSRRQQSYVAPPQAIQQQAYAAPGAP